jgi:hypothetical protein
MEAVDDVHQRRFPSAVLADESMDAARRNRQRDRAISVNSTEAFLDAT